VSHVLSLATTTARRIPGIRATASANPIGSPPGVQARNVSGASSVRIGAGISGGVSSSGMIAAP
jgi:hypothetical protein